MNRYDEYYDFRIATIEDVDDIMIFIDKYWKKNHILAVNKEFFLFQYGTESDIINVYLMLNKCGKIVGINGFIQYSYDENIKSISSAITKVIDDLDIPMCGVELIKRFKEYTRADQYFSSGTNPNTMLPIGKRIFKYHTGRLKQYYILNSSMDSYRIASINKKKYDDDSFFLEEEICLKEITNIEKLDFDFSKIYSYLPYKSSSYFKKRFFKHPIYKYNNYAIYEKNDIKGIIFTRNLYFEKSSAIRIVDFVGDIQYIGKIRKHLDKLLIESNAEYIELPCSGLNNDIISNGGWEELDYEENIVIPTYFEPFVKENIQTYYQKSDEKLIVFKADGDQDRPNYNNKGERYEFRKI